MKKVVITITEPKKLLNLNTSKIITENVFPQSQVYYGNLLLVLFYVSSVQ